MLKFEKPDYKVKEYIKDSHYGKFELEPLERGFGTTLGNALRRVMLSSLPGDAITSVKIDGVAHEFQKIDGVVEDVTAIVLNLKSIVIKNHAKDENKIIRLTKNTPGVVTAGDIEKDADIEILNPDQVIATLVEGGSLNMEMTIGSGRGYVVADDNKKLLQNDKTKVGAIAIDSLYSPVERINYEVETARVGQNNNFDKLILEVWTNGSISPEEALALAARILIEHFEILTSLNAIADETGLMISKSEDPSVKILETSIDDLDFSVRAYNCLKRANILTLKDLVDKSENEMMKIRNLGKKSLKEVMDKIKEIEKTYNVLVYAVTHEYLEFGECYDFLYIPDYKNEWKYALLPQKDIFYAYAYVWNKTDDNCSEFGTIGIRSFGGGIKRVM